MCVRFTVTRSTTSFTVTEKTLAKIFASFRLKPLVKSSKKIGRPFLLTSTKKQVKLS